MSEDYASPLPFLTAEQAPARSQPLMAATEKALGFVPNMHRAMANSPGLLATYLDGYRRFHKGSGLSPAEQEVVFLTISRFNGCDYCMAAHSFMGDVMSFVPTEAIDALRDDTPIADTRLRAVSDLTRELLVSGGHPTDDAVQAFRAAGYLDEQILEILLAIAVKTMSNWTNHLFHTPVDKLFSARQWKAPGE